MQWSTIEDGIHAWVTSGSGLAASKVIWAQQDAPRPAAPYIAIRVQSVRAMGQDWIDIEDAADPQPGAEINHVARGMRELTVTLQAFGTAGIGSSSPTALLSRVVSAMRLPTSADALRAAGFSVGTVDPILSLDAVRGFSVFEPRAILTLRGFAVSEMTESGTYIEFLEVENLDTGDVFAIPY
jgi:hypothetical protein